MPAGMTIRQTGESPRTGGADGGAGRGGGGRAPPAADGGSGRGGADDDWRLGRAEWAPTTTGDWAGPSGRRRRLATGPGRVGAEDGRRKPRASAPPIFTAAPLLRPVSSVASYRRPIVLSGAARTQGLPARSARR